MWLSTSHHRVNRWLGFLIHWQNWSHQIQNPSDFCHKLTCLLSLPYYSSSCYHGDHFPPPSEANLSYQTSGSPSSYVLRSLILSVLDLGHKEGWVSKNWSFWTVVLKTLESPLDCKEIKPVNPKENNPECSLEGLMLTLKLMATWWEELTHCKRTWCWERLKAGEGDDRGWNGWMASPTQWTWV